MLKQALRVVVPVLSAALLLGLIYVGSAGNWFTASIAHAQTTPGGQPATTFPGAITVVGEGKVTLVPDIAHVTIGVETVTNTVKAASDENNEIVNNVLATLKEQGIDEKDMQTSGFSIYAERFGTDGPLSNSDVRYHVTNNVNVTVRDLDKLGDILDAAIDAGANNINGIDFAVADPSASESDARTAALADAKAKATDLAKLSGITLGPVVSISEVIGGNGGFYAGNFAQQAKAMGGGATPVSPGQLDLVMQLQVIYSIAQ